MITPAKAHWQRALAATITNTESQDIPAGAANQYELMLLKLAEDKRRLKEIQSIERKIEVKATLLPEYLPWIEGVLDAGSGRQDDVLMTVFVWAIDIADFALAIKIGAYAIEHRLTMPDQYKRDVPCVLAEEVANVIAFLVSNAASYVTGTSVTARIAAEAGCTPAQLCLAWLLAKAPHIHVFEAGLDLP